MNIKKVLKREVFIREYDWEKTLKRDAKHHYDRATWTPVTEQSFAKLHTWYSLKDDKPNSSIYAAHEYPHSMMIKLKSKLYNKVYCDWMVSYDGEGYLTVRSRSNLKPSRMGWAVLEKDIYERSK